MGVVTTRVTTVRKFFLRVCVHACVVCVRVCRRAEKCYRKALSLQSSHPGAAINLGDILWANGDEV